MIELTIKRPNGEIEKVQTSKFGYSLSKVLFGKIQDATKAAGKGEVLSWGKVDDRTAEEKAAHDLADKIEGLKIGLAKAHRTNNAWLVSKIEKQLDELKK